MFGTTSCVGSLVSSAGFDPRSNERLPNAAGIGRELQRRVDTLLRRFGAAGFADVHGASIAALQGGGDAHLARKGVARRLPGVRCPRL